MVREKAGVTVGLWRTGAGWVYKYKEESDILLQAQYDCTVNATGYDLEKLFVLEKK